MIGHEIGSWVVERELGEGGMGKVYLARHKSLGTQAAIKVMAPAFSHDQRLHDRFSREARTQAQLRHPNIAQVLDHVEHEGRWCLIVDYLPGGTLEDVLAAGAPIPIAKALAWSCQALRGLDYAHSKGIVHRDVKPANILLNDRGEAAMTDFGIALELGARRLTQTGFSIGTPEYMSPEQIRGEATVDHRADVYSMGTVVYELLAGRPPFEAGSTFEVQAAQVHQPPPPLRQVNPRVPAELEALVMRALEKDPQARWSGCGEFADALEAFERGEAPVLPLRPLAAAPVAAAMAPVAAAAMAPPPPPPVQRSRTVAINTRDRPAVQATGSAPPPPPMKKPAKAVSLGTAALLTAVVGSGIWWLNQDKKADEPTKEEGKTTEEPPPPPVPETPPPPAPPPPPPVQRAVVQPPPPPMMALPDRPTVAVVAAGDDLTMAGAVEGVIERRLLQGGFDVQDEHNSLELEQLLEEKGKDVQLSEVLPILAKEGYHVIVLIKVEVGEEREMHAGGQYLTFRASRLRMNAQLLPARKSLGRGWSEKAEYTELNTDAKAKQAFISASGELVNAIRAGWQQLKGGR